MESVSDPPFRLLCKEYGADLLYTEFANCEAIIRDVPRTMKKMRIQPHERPIGVQIYGSGESSMERAAAAAESLEPDFIDINCGCWVKKIAMRGDGAGLLRDIQKFETVVRAVMRGTRLPVTVKTRLGWDENSICILDVARMLEQNGVQALTLHCRTRTQAYRGQADWAWLEKVRAVTAMPLIGNGDIKTGEDARRVFDTGVDGIMIGRGAIHAPWVFRHMRQYLATGAAPEEPSLADRVDLCIRHLALDCDYKGERRGVLEFRKFYAGYLREAPHIARLRAELMRLTEQAPVVERLLAYREAI